MDVNAAIAQLKAIAGFPDLDPPFVTAFLINGGSTMTVFQNVTLTVAASDTSGVAEMCMSNEASAGGAAGCTTWEGFAGSKQWWLGDGDNGIRTVYLWLKDSVGNAMQVPATASINLQVDGEPPNATLSINNGSPITFVRQVTLTITASDASGVASQCISNTPTSAADCAPWENFMYGVAQAWTLATGDDGIRTVYLFLRDPFGNAMQMPATATINLQLDCDPPNATLSINNGANVTTVRQVTLAITASDVSGAATQCISNTLTSGADCAPWENFTTPRGWMLAAGANGPRTVYLFLTDKAGNMMSTPANAAIDLQVDQNAPKGTVVINGGAATTTTGNVTLTVTGEDANGISKMCISNTAACTLFQKYSATVAWTLGGSTAGQYTVYVYLRDALGNTMQTPATASITLVVDTEPPTCAVAINGGANVTRSLQVTLTVTAGDATGVGRMCISNADVAASSCAPFVAFVNSTGWTLAEGPDGKRTVRVFLSDTLGNNMTTPATADIYYESPPDTEPPTGLVLINKGAPRTNSRNVTLTISGQDSGSGVERMCVSSSPAGCTLFEPYVTIKPWTLEDGPDGPRTVYVLLSDSKGNTMTDPAEASIILDRSPTSSLVINGGAPFTSSPALNLQISAKDASNRFTRMCVSQTAVSDAACAPWGAYQTYKRLTLTSPAQGPQTLRVFFQDPTLPSRIDPAVATVIFDSRPPDTMAMRINVTGVTKSSITLLISAGADDATSGVAYYLAVGRKAAKALSSCSLASSKMVMSQKLAAPPPGAPAADGGAPAPGSVTFSGLKAQAKYAFRVCAADNANNLAAGVVVVTKTTAT